MDRYVYVVKAGTSTSDRGHEVGGKGTERKKTSLQHDRQDREYSRRHRPYPFSPRSGGRTALSPSLAGSLEVRNVTDTGERQVTDKDIVAPPPTLNKPSSLDTLGPSSTALYYNSVSVQDSDDPMPQNFAGALANTEKDIFDLKDRENPITHSTAFQRSEYITSVATGHEQSRGKGQNPSFYLKHEMLRGQTKPSAGEEQSKGPKSILHGLRIYVNGYTRGTTRTEIIRLVELHGGMNLGATHVITSMNLNPSSDIVTPEWLYESIEAGKILNEWKYRVLESESQAQLTWSK
ncbi:hypothetical protein BS47DRAFT_1338404 [Hydnum rufescens UP504]|uniref:BRCT domain-containing protein n=1 Tax=Hydnum rufescens UP504 TaxID=1448309 RepID=A0A9P6DYH4_9AGAM|nr:hypothetical protein BS47DRAFT_1338404 [Hydnum rufescens UP504]